MPPIQDDLRERVLQLWGKMAAHERFHPTYHMLDVGHVAPTSHQHVKD